MSAAMLVRIEWLKARKSVAFLSCVGGVLAMLLLAAGGSWYFHLTGRSGQGITLPRDWIGLVGRWG